VNGCDIGQNKVTQAPLLMYFQLNHEKYTFVNAEYGMMTYTDKKYPILSHLSYSNDVGQGEKKKKWTTCLTLLGFPI
jgi:hypothetical protein